MEKDLANFSVLVANDTFDFNLKKILNQYKNNENHLELDYIISIIKQKQTDIEFIKPLLEQLKTNVDVLDPETFENSLIQQIVYDIKWYEIYSNDQDILYSLSDFLIDLNSAYTGYNYKCLSMLLKNFLLVNSQFCNGSNLLSETRTSIKSLNCQAIYEFSHNIIKHLIKIIPSCKAHIPKLFDNMFPYMNKETAIQEAFLKNLLIVAENISDIRLILLEICIQKLLKIDVNCQSK